MFLFQRIWDAIKWLFGLIVPFFAKAAELTRTGHVVLWILRIVVLSVILVALGYLNYVLDLGRSLKTPMPELRLGEFFWLPILFLLGLLLLNLFLGLLKIVRSQDVSTDYPDLDAAWQDAVTRLEQAGASVSRTPIFLILGRRKGGDAALLNAGSINLLVNQAERRPADRFHVYADREGIYVTFPESSLVARQATMSEEAAQPVMRASTRTQVRPVEGPLGSGAGGIAQAIQHSGSVSPSPSKSATATLAPPVVAPAPATVAAAEPTTVRRRLLSDPIEIDDLSRRLAYVCRLIARSRAPYCPINGILAALPGVSVQGDNLAQHYGSLLRSDLATIRRETAVHCPTFVAICDLEREPGFDVLRSRIPAELLPRRFGHDAPLVPDVPAQQLSETVESGIRWLCQNVAPATVLRLLAVDHGAEGRATKENAQLFKLLSALEERTKRLARLVIRGVMLDAPAPVLYGGCYLAATGEEETSRAFMPGIFRLLIENQNYVSWSQPAVDANARRLAWTTAGYSLLVIAAIPMAWFLYTYWP